MRFESNCNVFHWFNKVYEYLWGLHLLDISELQYSISSSFEEHVIYRWEDESPRLHEALLEYYARKVKELLKEYTHAFHDGEHLGTMERKRGYIRVS